MKQLKNNFPKKKEYFKGLSNIMNKFDEKIT